MHRRDFLVLLGGVVLTPSAAAAESATQVAVLDAEFRPIKVIAAGPDLAAFDEHWTTRRPSAELAMSREYKIDIKYGHRSERWLYDPQGFARVLSKGNTAVYRLESPTAFNELLGINQHRIP